MLNRPQQLPHVDFASGKLRAQRLVVPAAAEFDGVEKEADMFNQHLVGHCFGIQCSGAIRALSRDPYFPRTDSRVDTLSADRLKEHKP